MKRKKTELIGVLGIAERLIHGDRRAEYGPADESFKTIATMWNAYLAAKHGTQVTFDIEPEDVSMMMVLFKTCRQANKHKRDNLVDICGYAALTDEIVGDS